MVSPVGQASMGRPAETSPSSGTSTSWVASILAQAVAIGRLGRRCRYCTESGGMAVSPLVAMKTVKIYSLLVSYQSYAD